MRNTLVCLGLATAVAIGQGCGATTASTADLRVPDPRAAVLAEFRQRIDAYMELREKIVDEVGEAESTVDVEIGRAHV